MQWRQVGFLVAVVVLGSSHGASGAPPGIEWDKDKDAFQTPNRPGAARESRNGTCNGDAELSFAWHAARQKDPSLPALADVEREILSRPGGNAYLLRIRELAQRASYNAGPMGVSIAAPGGRPRAAEATLAEAAAAVKSGQPARLILSGMQSVVGRDGMPHQRRILHTVTAYQTAEAGGTVGLRVADSSAAGRSALLVIDGKTGARKAWEEVSEGDLGRVAWDRADLVSSPPADAALYVRLVEAARKGVPPAQIEAALGLDAVPPPSSGAILADPKAGGIWIAFDPSVYEGTTTEAAVDEWVAQAQAFLATGAAGGLALLDKEHRETVHLVSLAATLRAKAATLAPLTRIRGYVLTEDDVWLVGPAEPSGEPVPVDVLVVALQTVWQRGLTPYVSLDPNPDDLVGAPRPRVGDLPADLRETAFVRILFAADYAMKEIVLGARPLDIDGWRSMRDVLADADLSTSDQLVRMWLTPLSAPVADVLESRCGEETAVWFQGRVQLQSEEMLLSDGVMVGKGRVDPLWAGVATAFTARYDDIAARVPVFRRLATVFDCAKACAIWRARDVRHRVLDALAAKAPATNQPAPVDEPRAPFPGVGLLPVPGKDVVLSGGARAKVRVRPQGLVSTDRLAPLCEAARRGAPDPIEISLPAVIALDPEAVASVDTELSAAAAAAHFRSADLDRAEAALSRVLAVDPADAEAWMLRSMVRYVAGRVDESGEDLLQALTLDPRYRAQRGLVRVMRGEREDGLADAAEAERLLPDDEFVLVVAGLARLRALDLPGAERSLRQLRALSPGHPAARDLDNELQLLRSMSKEQAEARLAHARSVPPRIQLLVERGSRQLEADPLRAIAVLDEALAEAEVAPSEAVRSLHIVERTRFVIGLAAWALLPRMAALDGLDFVAARARLARKHAEALVAAHPDWPSGYLLRALLAASTNAPEEAVTAVAMAFDRAGNPDAILDDLAPQWGTTSMVAMLGTSIAWALWERGADASAVLARCAAALPAGGTSRALSVLARHPEINLARFIDERSHPRGVFMDADGLRATLSVLREVEAALDDAPAADAIDQMFLAMFHEAYLPLEQDVGQDFARLLEATLQCLRSTERIGVRPRFVESVHRLRAMAYVHAGAALAGRATTNLLGPFKDIGARLLAAKEARDAVAIRAALSDLSATLHEHLPRLRSAVAGELEAIAKAAGSRTKDVVLLQLAVVERKTLRGMDPDRERTNLTAFEGVAGTRELGDYLAALAEAREAGLFVAEDPAAVLERIVAAPRDAHEAETLLRFLPFAKDMVGSLFPEGAAPVDLDAATNELRLRLRLAAFPTEPSIARSTEAASEPHVPSSPLPLAPDPAPGDEAARAHPQLALWLASIAVLFVLVVLIARRRRG